MKKTLISIIAALSLGIVSQANGANLHGRVGICDSHATQISDAEVLLYQPGSSDTLKVTTNFDGNYDFMMSDVDEENRVDLQRPMDVQIFDVLGRKVVGFEDQIPANFQFKPNGEFSSGIYFAQFTSKIGKDHSFIKKMVFFRGVNAVKPISNADIEKNIAHKPSGVGMEGIYTLQISAPGFKTIIHPDLNINGDITFNAVLPAVTQYIPNGPSVKCVADEYRDLWFMKNTNQDEVLCWNPNQKIIYVDLSSAFTSQDSAYIQQAIGSLYTDSLISGSLEDYFPQVDFVGVDTLNQEMYSCPGYGIYVKASVNDWSCVPVEYDANWYQKYVWVNLDQNMGNGWDITIKHEFGHALGLAPTHPTTFESMMNVPANKNPTPKDQIYLRTAKDWRKQQDAGLNNAKSSEIID